MLFGTFEANWIGSAFGCNVIKFIAVVALRRVASGLLMFDRAGHVTYFPYVEDGLLVLRKTDFYETLRVVTFCFKVIYF